ncbi:MAG TPA: methyltransferase domain-containing protein [Gammaproteobacteria bacterium]|nr:methyltransferase domain-containing protein [Gammaproteobacteria bacterium]
MIKTYHNIRQWAHWLTHWLGIRVIECEQKLLSRLLKDRYGKNALLIGVAEQRDLLKSCLQSKHILLSPLMNKNVNLTYIESGFNELPIFPGSIDLVLLPHTLDFIDNPRQLLMEACRVVKPEGDIIIFGFNPFSFWGLKKWWNHHKNIPWSGHFLRASTVKKWLKLADFELIRQDSLMFRPPLKHPHLFDKFKFLEWVGTYLYFLSGGIFVITARAKVIPLSPIKLRWEQTLPTFSVKIPGPSMRDIP